MKSFRNFLHDRSAVISIEAALIMLPFMALLGATVDAGLLFFRATQLQVVAENAGRLILTHQIENKMSYQKFLDDYVCTWQKPEGVVAPGTLGKMFDCKKLIIDIRMVASWKTADMDDSFAIRARINEFDIPQPGTVGVLRIAYPVKSFFGFGIPAGSSSLIQKIRTHSDAQIRDPGVTNIVFGVTAFRVEPGL